MIESLRTRHPWPEVPPWADQDVWDLGSRGRELIVDLIRSRGVRTIVEVGSFMGGSARRWLDASPHVIVIAIDPWEGDWWVNYAAKRGRSELARRFGEPNGPYLAFQSAMWPYRERLVAVKGTSPGKLHEIAALGIRPDLLHFDSDKEGNDFEIAMQLWPAAIMTGDDWTWDVSSGYPARRAARRLAAAHGMKIRVKGETWVLAERLSLADYANLAESTARDIARAVRHRLRAA